MLKHLPAIILLIGLTGCGTIPAPQTPQQAVFEAQGIYKAALRLEVEYDKKPRCATTSLTICSDPATVKWIKNIDIASWAAIRTAQNTVRTKGFGDNAYQSAAIAAMNAAQGFSDAASQLRIK